MAPDKACYDFIKSKEGLFLKAYTDSAGIWTIGYGTIKYENNVMVKKGDVIIEQRANELLKYEVDKKAISVVSMTTKKILTQNQFNALVSFAYNVGVAALQGSTLLKRVLANPKDVTIRDAFMMWNKCHVDGKLVVVAGLTNRRRAEADLYFS